MSYVNKVMSIINESKTGLSKGAYVVIKLGDAAKNSGFGNVKTVVTSKNLVNDYAKKII